MIYDWMRQFPQTSNPSKQYSGNLKMFRPLTDDIINKSYQVNSYIEDFPEEKANISDEPQNFSINELLDTLLLNMQSDSKENVNNSIFEKYIEMIPTSSNSNLYNRQDQITKEIFMKINKFYTKYNKIIENEQPVYHSFNKSLKYTDIIHENPHIEFNLRNDFVISENVQIATNGIELFLLVDHFVFIFKLLIGTELLVNSYKRVDLDPNIKDYNQIVCYGQDILVTSSSHYFIIERKMNGEWEVKKIFFESFTNPLFCSDGVVLIVLNRIRKNQNKFIEYFVYSLNDGSLILHNYISNDYSNSNILDVFDSPKFLITNGSILTIVNKGKELYYVSFSLNYGQFIQINMKFPDFNGNKPLCFHHDSINNSQWILSDKKIDEFTNTYFIGRYPSFLPYNPFVLNEMKHYYTKCNMDYFGFYNIRIFSKIYDSKNPKIFYGKELNDFKNNQNLFLFLFPSLFFNPFLSHMDQNVGEENQKYRIDDTTELPEEYKKYIKKSFTTFIKYFFANSFENSPILALWILRQYQFSWYSKIHSQKMLESYKSIFDITQIKNIKISSLLLNIFSINSISGAIIDNDDDDSKIRESGYFIYFLQSIGYDREKTKHFKIINEFLMVVFDLLPLISYRKKMVVTYFTFLDMFGYSNNRSFFVYSLFISMAISCLLVSKNDLKWSYDDNDILYTNSNVLNYMNTIYRHWKPLVNKNINEKVKFFDAKCLFVFYKLISGKSIDTILQEIETNIKTNKDLQISLDLMYSYRNKYRKSMQEKNEKWFEKTDKLLDIMNCLKCDFNNDDKKALINEFMQHDYHIANNFKYKNEDKKQLIIKGMKQLNEVIENLSKHEFITENLNNPELYPINELYVILFDLLTRFSKFNYTEMIKDDNFIILIEQIIVNMLKINEFQCINKYSALYIFRSLESCKNKELNEKVFNLLHFDIQKGEFSIDLKQDIYYIYTILVLYLIPSIECSKLEFLKNDILKFNRFQWILLNRIINLKCINDQNIMDHLIESITNIEIFRNLGEFKSISLEILNKLNQINKIDKIDSFINKIFEKIGEEIEFFDENNDNSLISSYFIEESKKNSESFIFRNQFNNLISSNKFASEKLLCCSFKLISSLDDLLTNPEFSKKIFNYFTYGMKNKTLTSGYLAMSIINKFLSKEDFCDKIVNEFDIDEIIYKLKSNNNQASIIKRINKLHSLKENVTSINKFFNVITTNEGTYFISPTIKNSCTGKLLITKEKESSKIQIFICEESPNSKLFNVITHSKENFLENQKEVNLIINSIQKQIFISDNNSLIFTNAKNPVRLVIFSDEGDETNLKIFNENIFSKTENFIDRKSYGMFNIPKKKSFINKQKYSSETNDSSDILQNKLNEQLCFQFLYEKRKTLISLNEIVTISPNLKESIIRSYKKHLTETTFFITAVKMVSFHPEILSYNSDFMLQLFILLILNYDTFSIESFEKEEFPFKIGNIILKSNFVSNCNFDDLNRYTIQSVLQSITSIPSFISVFYYHIKNLYREYYSHFPRQSEIIEFGKTYEKPGFVFIPQFCENYKITVNINNSVHQLPCFAKQAFSVQKSATQYLFYKINPNKRNWIFNSPFEFLILLKYFIYLSSSRKERELAKSCLFEAYFINSPILSLYSIEFLKYMFLYIPYESDNLNEPHFSYQKSLLFYQKQSQSKSVFYQLFLNIEIMSKADPCISKFYKFFPEFSRKSKKIDELSDNFSIKDFSIYSSEKNFEMNDLIFSYKVFNLINFFKIKNNEDFPYFNFFKYWATALQEEMILHKKDINLISLPKLKKQFIDDVNDFILIWTNEYTKEVLNSFIDVDFNVPKVPFYIISKTVNKLTSLHTKFQMNLILAVVLVLYEINRSFQFSDVENISKLIPDFTDYLIPKSAIQLIRNSIIVNQDTSNLPRLYIDRKSVYLNQNHCSSIIEQFAVQVKKIGVSNFRCQKPPFRVTFINEEAIDASGPMRELLTEIANSIFQKQTNLIMTTPSDLSLFIPYTTNFSQYKEVYYAIGVYIGIVIRTSIPQTIPFAPLVWNYLSNETITEKDIVTVDSNLGETFKNIRKSVEDHCEIHFPWKATNWNSTEYTIKGKIGKYVNENEVEEYIQSVVNDRIDLILNPLIEMRKGFIDNIGLKSHMPFGNLLSQMAQSESTFTVEDLMAIARYRSCSFESKSVSVFWAAVKRLTMDQLSLLLKFITTQTRIPNDEFSNFTIDIVEKNPSGNVKSDEMLLGASTCFNRLYLPCYSTPEIAYQKIITSIEYCQTMELS